MPSRREEFAAYAVARMPAVLRLAHLATGDSARSAEIAEDALAAAYRRWRELRHGDADGFLREYVVRAALRAPAAPADAAPPQPDADPAWVALGRLPARRRIALVLRYADGLDDAEIARLLRVSARTARGELARALAAVEAELAGVDAVETT